MCIQKKKKDTISQVVSPLCLVACVAVWIWLKKRGNRRGGEEEKKKKSTTHFWGSAPRAMIRVHPCEYGAKQD